MSTFVLLIISRITNTWAFMWQSFGVIKSYRPLILLPVISAVFCVLVSIIVLGGGALVFDIPIHAVEFAPEPPQVSAGGVRQLTLVTLDLLLGGADNYRVAPPTTDAERRMREHVWLLLLLFYLVNYAVIVYFNVAFAAIALERLGGRDATLDDGLRIAWARKYTILQWALVSGTVGILLKMVRERSAIEGWVARLLGYLWRLATFFVMPLLALENIGPGEALYRSAALLKRKWGEVVVAGFSFSLVFAVLAIPGMAIFLLAGFLGQAFGLAAILAMSYWVLLAIALTSAAQVFTSALYRYAADDKASKGFARSDLESAWDVLKPLPIGQAL
jgi:hypothetical protein